jgi:Asp-tRNA(Asn)/Glu-tRNA(Gln) amidotransferase A subunit family amidase
VTETHELTFGTAADLQRLYTAGLASPLDVVNACLDRIDTLQPHYRLFAFVYPDEARQQARVASKELLGSSAASTMDGIPYALKDYTPTRGRRTTRGSHAFEGWIPDEDPPVVERLGTAKAILVGKTTTSELAHGSFTRSRLWGTSRNPWNPSKTPGGSSGGSAGAVAAGLVTVAEGSDAGGSIRIPASCCGVVGFKPSLGRVPAHFLPSDFEQVFQLGPIARTVADAAAMFEVMQGPDERDPLSQPAWTKAGVQSEPSRPRKRVGLSFDLGYYNVHPSIRANTRRAALALEEVGFDVEEVDLGWDSAINEAWETNWCVALATFYGEAIDRIGSLADPELLKLIEKGRSVRGVELKSVDIVRTWQWRRLRRVFERVDFLVCPTLAVPVPPAEGVEDSDFGGTNEWGQFEGFEMTSPFNLVPQCPVVSVPSGFDDDGLPTGIQVVGRRFDDAGVLTVSAALEEARPWSHLRPACVIPSDKESTGGNARDERTT